MRRTRNCPQARPCPKMKPRSAMAYGMLSGSSSSAGFVLVPPVAKAHRTLSKGFFLLNGMHLGMAVFDVEMTQHCIANHHCVEGNPLMPSSQAGQLGVNFAAVGLGAFFSYKMKEQDNGMWVLSRRSELPLTPSAWQPVLHTASLLRAFAGFRRRTGFSMGREETSGLFACPLTG